MVYRSPTWVPRLPARPNRRPAPRFRPNIANVSTGESWSDRGLQPLVESGARQQQETGRFRRLIYAPRAGACTAAPASASSSGAGDRRLRSVTCWPASTSSVVGAFGRAEARAGATHKGLCPFHGEKSPSFTVGASQDPITLFLAAAFRQCRQLPDGPRHGLHRRRSRSAPAGQMTVPEDTSSAADRQEQAAATSRSRPRSATCWRAAEFRRQLKSSDAPSYPEGPQPRRDRGTLGLATCPRLAWTGGVFPSYDDPLWGKRLVIAQGGDGGDAGTRRGDTASCRPFRDRILDADRPLGRGGHRLRWPGPRSWRAGKYLNSPGDPVFSKGRRLYGLFEAHTGIPWPRLRARRRGLHGLVAWPDRFSTVRWQLSARHVHRRARYKNWFRFSEEAVVSSFDDARGTHCCRSRSMREPAACTDTRSFGFSSAARAQPDTCVENCRT